jgi:uncharacterized protein YjbI with pentapeptide repeats
MVRIKKKADFKKYVLKDEKLYQVQCGNADLTSIKLRKARILAGEYIQVKFDFADLTGAYMPRSLFEDCTFNDAKLQEIYLRGSVFKNCRIRNCSFNSANLCEVKFLECEISASDFTLAEFSEATIKETSIKGCKMFLADFTSVSPVFLSGIRDQIKGAIIPAGVTNANR